MFCHLHIRISFFIYVRTALHPSYKIATVPVELLFFIEIMKQIKLEVKPMGVKERLHFLFWGKEYWLQTDQMQAGPRRASQTRTWLRRG
jgi:hypothetical protein